MARILWQHLQLRRLQRRAAREPQLQVHVHVAAVHLDRLQAQFNAFER